MDRMALSQLFGKKGAESRYWAVSFFIIYFYPLINGNLNFKNPASLLAADCVAYCALPALVLWFLRLVNKSTFDELVGELSASVFGIAASVMIGFAVAYGFYSAMMMARQYDVVYREGPTAHGILLSEYGLAAVLYLSVSAGIVEELLYKAILYRSIAGTRFNGPANFAILSATLFGIAHYEQGLFSAMFYSLFYGVPSAIYYWKARNLANLIAIHVVTDFFLFGWTWANS